MTAVTRTAEPALAAARQIADELVRPAAELVDRTVVPRSHLHAWGRAGLLGLAGPRAAGGADAPRAVVREVAEVLAGACLSTWFVATQHATPLATLVESRNDALRDRLLRPLCTGEVLSGVAIAHLRRAGAPAVAATRVERGWRFDGHVGWMTSWGLCEVFLLGGLSSDGQVVLAMVPARDGDGLAASAPLRLAAMQATQTVTLELDGFLVADADVADVRPVETWLSADAAKTANAGPHVFGLHAECVRRLDGVAARRDDGTAAALAQQLRNEGERLRRVAYTLLDDVPEHEQLEVRLEVRAASLELLVRSATALVVATGGSAMAIDAPAQRLAREALFCLVQAQTAPVREATLQLLREAS